MLTVSCFADGWREASCAGSRIYSHLQSFYPRPHHRLSLHVLLRSRTPFPPPSSPQPQRLTRPLLSQLMVLTPNLDSLNILLQACLIMLATASLHDLVWTWSTGLPSPRRKFQAWVFTGPYEAVALFRMILPTWLGGYVRGSDIDVNSVLVPARPPFSKRFMWLVLDPHSGVLFVFAGSIGVSIWRAVREHRAGRVDTHQTACAFLLLFPLRFSSQAADADFLPVTLLLTVAWPSMIWIDILYGSLVP